MKIIKYRSSLFKISPKELSVESSTFDRIREIFRTVRGYVIYALVVDGKIITTAHIKHNYLMKYRFMRMNDCILNPYWTHQDYRNKGYAQTLLNNIIKEKTNWNHLFAVVSTNNTPSICCLEAVGMRRIGYAKKGVWSYRLTQEPQHLVIYYV